MAAPFSVVNRRRRTTGAFSPTDLDNLFGWWDPSQTAGRTLVGDDVSELNDLSGNGYDITASAGERGKLLVAKQNGRDILDFNGVTERYAGTSTTLSAPYTIHVLYRHQDLNQPAGAGGFDYAVALHNSGDTNVSMSLSRWNGDGVNDDEFYSFDGATVRRGPLIPGHTWHHVTFVALTASPFAKLYIDGTEVTFDDFGSAPDSNGDIDIGHYGFGANPHWFLGRFAEMAIYSDEQTDAEITTFNTYLLDKWAHKTSPTLSFPSIASLIARGEAHTTLKNGADISEWFDLSGSDNPLLQATGSRQPAYTSANGDFNDEPTIDFPASGGQEYMATAAFTGGAITQPNTIMMCVKLNQDTLSKFLIDGIATGNRHTIYNLSGSYYGYAGLTDNVAGLDTSVHVLAFIFNTTSSKIYEDGGAALDGAMSFGTNTLTGLTMAARFNFIDAYDMDVAAWAVFDGELTTDQMDDVGDFWNQEYGTNWVASS